MFFISSVDLVIVLATVGFGGFYCWAQQQGLLIAGQGTESGPGPRRISLLTEAGAYAGVILVLAGGVTAVSQRWDAITGGEQAGVFAAAAVFFLLAGLIVRQVRDPAIQRLGEVTWFLSVASVGVAAALWVAMDQVNWNKDAVTVLAAGAAVTACAAALWLVRRSALQSFALFAGLVSTITGVAAVITARPGTGAVPLPGSVPGLPASSLAIAGALWVFGLAWAGLGWRRYVGPVWVTVPCGVVLALVAPGFAAGGHGWADAIGNATAAAAMAASVRLRNTPLLALGALAMFGYLTAVAARYLHHSLGIPSALAITGVLITSLAVASARLTLAAHPPKPGESGTEEPSQAALVSEPGEPGADVLSSHRDRPSLLGRPSARHDAGQEIRPEELT